ncbi:InlB B-repeat-containing protein [Streptococcus suis]|uniref:InlB B-repeat-containing protein n=1 Tax=Streptococcus suis TaxID=1307 RepID=UPI0011476A12|nr:InlB B-repeat-containing protein [Streptococcus suis]MCK4004316.1 LPXTG cell wall anchor domain-containing protein [Streptococcus suis]NQI77792.1 LPXTG cell wall anchor domain-containing protein [Streptococcus suis]NQI79755.1 LPXTG cell wall anchor domain-containing protein [Streptococcus suis]NQI83192.1 LPXTG cell wall anchor domain-containing protein [Streptococcus suis]NQK51663.1 LPXTG cell wall anchor domain-containing protein [Streptococcus suis]
MSKQKVVSSLLLSTVVLGGLAFYPTTTVKAESLETDVTSVSSGDVVEKPVVSDGGESDFLAEEELEDDETLEEELNEKAEEVTEPSSPEALLQPRAVMSNSGSNDMEEIPVDDSVSEKIADTPLIQTSNVDSKAKGDDQAKIRASVSVEPLKVEKNKLEWQVTFDTEAWSFDKSPGGFYFVLPEGLELTEIIDNDHGSSNIINDFPTDVNAPKNDGGQKYRFFSKEEKRQDDKNFDSQWGWSAEQANPDVTVQKWKSEGRFSKIYFIDKITDTTRVTYVLTARITDSNQKSFPVAAVMKTFGYTNWSGVQFTSLGAREILLETPKETPMPPKEAPKPEEPKQEAPQTPAPDAPQPEGSKDTPEASPKPEAPESSGIVELGTIPKESLKVKVTFKEKGDILTTPDSTYRLQEGQYLEEVIIGSNIEDTLARAQKRVTTKEGYEFVGWALESDPEKEIEKNLKVSHDITLVAIVRKKSSEETLKPMEPKVEKPTPEVPQVPEAPQTPEAPTEEPKKEDAPAPSTPSVPEEQPKETPAPEVPSTPEKQPEAPKEEPEQDAPQTPEAPSTPKEEAPKKEVPAPEVPSIPEEQPKETPVPEVPKQEEVQPEAPKSDKVETDKPMPETKKPDMKQPKADDMPKEQKPKAEEPKAEQPQMDKPQMEAPKKDSEAPKTGKTETDKPMPETKKPDMKQPKADDMPKEQTPKAEAPKAEQPQMDKPQMEAPKKDSEAPKTGKVETDKPMPETKKPDMKQPKADDMPKEQKPKAEAPKAEQPQMDKPQMEAPKKDSEAPKYDKVETDKPMPETKKPDMKQPKADKQEAEKTQMPRTEGMKPESKVSMMPKAEAPKATLPNTGEASSAIGWLGGALATLATGLYLFKNKKEE